MESSLSRQELEQLITAVFSPSSRDKSLGIIVDVPDTKSQDSDSWLQRRLMARDWASKLDKGKAAIGLESVSIVLYKNVGNNNADLPELFFRAPESIDGITGDTIEDLPGSVHADSFFSTHDLIIAPTEFSATAPLKLNAKKHGFRAVTMPGFSSQMVPALQLDYREINDMVHTIKGLLDKSTGADMRFSLETGDTCDIHFDLRFRTAHASGGRFPETGHAGNLPSGEAYIVPYEGELPDTSLSDGILPVQFGEEVVMYNIKANKAAAVLSSGPVSDKEREKITNEPAYANIAELGFGVLQKYGLKPVNEILLDEKLGLHIAFGRSDHFGGSIGVKDFSSPDKVVHIDRIYIPEIQNKINVDYVSLTYDDGSTQTIMENGTYTIF